MRLNLLTPLVLLLVAACGQQQPVPPGPRAAAVAQSHAIRPARAFVATAAGIAVVDTATGATLRTLPAGTPAPGWRWLYTLRSSRLNLVDPASGSNSHEFSAPEWATGLRTSPGGSWLVLIGPGGRFQLRDAALAKAPVDITLGSNYTFDGVTDDGRALYLLQWVSPGRYFVRRFDVPTHALSEQVIFDKQEGQRPMSGEGVRSLPTADGRMQFTLYRHNAKGRSFVHALPLDTQFPFAFCIDLPGPDSGWTLVPAPDGIRFYAAHPSAGQLVELTTDNDVSHNEPHQRTANVPGLGGAGLAAAVGADGRTLYLGGARGVTAVNVADLKAMTHRDLGGFAVTALAAGPGAVYALAGGRLLTLDPGDLRVVTSAPAPADATDILRVT